MALRPTTDQLSAVPLSDVTVDDEFWSERLETNREVTLEHQYEQLQERCLENFRRVRDGETGGFQGMRFEDSDAYKWLEAASYELAKADDADLRKRVEEVIDLVASAQEENGYLNTYFALEEPEKKWTNLHVMHELYCAGHLIEAAVAHYEATGEESLLDVATAFADHIDDVFGTGEDQIDGTPGHEEVELALVKLYRVTDEQRYLDLAQYFVDRRGRASRMAWETNHLDEVAGDVYPELYLDDGEWDGSYAQAHAPVREQETVEGHSVRAMYLYTAVADLVAETGEEELYDTLETLWTNMTEKRMYITGGIGPESHHEGFTEDYDLRNRTAYAETCAAIGSVFWNRRMFQLTGEGRFYDVLERTLYNGFLAGVSLDGTEFFYENPLESLGHHHRKGWFRCACCPPNVARLFASLGEYVYAQSGDGEPYVNLYIGGEASLTVDGTDVTLSQRTEYPWGDSVTVEVGADDPVETTLHLRVPEWCQNPTATVNGDAIDAAVEDGYIAVERTWADGDTVALSFDLPVQRMEAHPDVPDDADSLAYQRGPLVYCVEESDLDQPPSRLRIDPGAAVETQASEDLLGGVVALEGDAEAVDADDWGDDLYREWGESERGDVTVTAIPYYGWDNREPGRMRVWLPTD